MLNVNSSAWNLRFYFCSKHWISKKFRPTKTYLINKRGESRIRTYILLYRTALTLPIAIQSTPRRSKPVAQNALPMIMRGGAICHGIFTSFDWKNHKCLCVLDWLSILYIMWLYIIYLSIIGLAAGVRCWIILLTYNVTFGWIDPKCWRR